MLLRMSIIPILWKSKSLRFIRQQIYRLLLRLLINLKMTILRSRIRFLGIICINLRSFGTRLRVIKILKTILLMM